MKIYLETDDNGSHGVIEKKNDDGIIERDRIYPKNEKKTTAARRAIPRIMDVLEGELVAGKVLIIDAVDAGDPRLDEE